MVDAVSAEHLELRDPDNEPLYVVAQGLGDFFPTRGETKSTPRDLADSIRNAQTPAGRPVWTEGQPIVLHSCSAGCLPLYDGGDPAKADVLSQYLGGTAVYAPDGTVQFSDMGDFLSVMNDGKFRPGTGFRRFGE